MRLLIFLFFISPTVFLLNSCALVLYHMSPPEETKKVDVLRRNFDFSKLKLENKLKIGELTYYYDDSKIELPFKSSELKKMQNALKIKSAEHSRKEFSRNIYLNYCFCHEEEGHYIVDIGFDPKDKKRISLSWHFAKRERWGENSYSFCSEFGGIYSLELEDDSLYNLLLNLAKETHRKINLNAQLQKIKLFDESRNEEFEPARIY